MGAMSLFNDLYVKDLPVVVRRWLERQEGQRLPNSHKVRVSAYSMRGSSKWSEERKRSLERRERRLNRVAAKMRKSGMNENDIKIVLRGGWDD